MVIPCFCPLIRTHSGLRDLLTISNYKRDKMFSFQGESANFATSQRGIIYLQAITLCSFFDVLTSKKTWVERLSTSTARLREVIRRSHSCIIVTVVAQPSSFRLPLRGLVRRCPASGLPTTDLSYDSTRGNLFRHILAVTFEQNRGGCGI